MIPVEEPLAIQVTRYQCPHCRTTRSKKTTAIAHIGCCWKNPANRTCKTCEHYEPAGDGTHCFPERPCGCNVYAEGCNEGVDIPDDRPATHCPKWELRREEWPC
ncbi:hypothetical protein [Streptomyces gardneri]|uniref:hypothetical protein n=1 Tax=Streptomyces gardneri TaxID=66892 RepID=UPI00367460B6